MTAAGTTKNTTSVGVYRFARAAIVGLAIAVCSPASAEQAVDIRYSNATAFDKSLSAAMRGEARVIKVSIVPPSDGRIPPRLKAWIDRLIKERGEVRWRDDGGRGAVAVLIGAVLSFLADKAIEIVVEALSDPVKNYHAVISFRMAGKTTQVLAIEFYKRDSAAWIEAIATSNATK